MLYLINGKYYILVSGYFKEVTVEKNRNEYNVIPVNNANKTKLEANKVKDYTTIDVESAYNNLNTRSTTKGL